MKAPLTAEARPLPVRESSISRVPDQARPWSATMRGLAGDNRDHQTPAPRGAPYASRRRQKLPVWLSARSDLECPAVETHPRHDRWQSPGRAALQRRLQPSGMRASVPAPAKGYIAIDLDPSQYPSASCARNPHPPSRAPPSAPERQSSTHRALAP
jgi:hypothetical protein